MKTWTILTVIVAALTLGTFASLSPSVAQDSKNLEQMITEAKTPADHEAIAAYYEKEAQEAHKKHAEHQRMEEWYKKNAALNKSGFSTHCDLIATNFDKTAKEYEALAKLHKDLAKAAK